uniref:Cupin type-1 domain-containing protein n=1 Tax=Nelumbo nucifera TaxID=4432 RepID=A0A822XM94_NELNU|nr:TPA_asm: hypothetical protein HUJ06_021358 [Nelumbo nucifera]
MAKSCLLSLGICLFILFHGCLAVRPYNSHQGQGWSTRPDHQSRGEQSECQINNLDALEPSRRIEAEAGQFEIWDDNNEQFRCAGVAAYRVTIQPKGLSLPVYHNQPRILYIVQGRGVLGLSIPGCPETFQLFQQDEQSEEEGCRSQRSEDEGSSSQRSKDQGGKSQQSEDQDRRRQKSGEQYSRSQQSEDQDSRRHKSESRSQGSKSQQSEHQSSTSRKSEDQHCRSHRSEDFYQQPRFFKEGDILMVPNGVSYWVYNDGDTPLVAIAVIDTRNNFNQLDRKVRNFWLAGNIQEQYSRSQQSEDQDSRRHKSESRSQGSKSQQSEHQSSTSRKSEDQHCRSHRSEDFYQQPRFFKEGDILMVPNGVSYWVYNDGDTPLVAIAVIDTRNNFNQLDRKVRNFWLAGNIQEQQEEEQRRGSSSSKSEEVGQESSNNVFSGFDAKILAQAFGVTKETVRKLQKKNDERGPIIQVERGLQVIKSISSKEQERQQETNENGLEETLCNMRLRQNIGKATSSDVYTPFRGRVTNVNSRSLPTLGL